MATEIPPTEFPAALIAAGDQHLRGADEHLGVILDAFRERRATIGDDVVTACEFITFVTHDVEGLSNAQLLMLLTAALMRLADLEHPK